MTATILVGNCLERLKELSDNSIDSIVTDPPYGLEFMGKDWDAPWKTDRRQRFDGTMAEDKVTPQGRSKVRNGGGASYGADARIMQEFQRWCEVWATECLRVLKPGGHILSFGGSRTYHRMACAIEDAGFEIRDQIMWIYGSGFPKSLDVSKAIDKAAKVEREVVGESNRGAGASPQKLANHATGDTGIGILDGSGKTFNITAPASEQAKEWSGWGTALKPAHEPICMARKPLVGTVAANVLEHGTGALNIDGCRVEHEEECRLMAPSQANIDSPSDKCRQAGRRVETLELKPDGRWPANVIHDGSEEVVDLFPDTGVSTGGKGSASGLIDNESIYGRYSGENKGDSAGGFGDSGSAARFFYTAKADSIERNMGHVGEERNTHPTVKPVDLMQYLCRLVTPPNGTVLDPFTGSGSTGIAALREGFNFIGVEISKEYAEIAERRIQGDNPMFNQVTVK